MLASTLTTIAVFVPVVFIQEEAGQLFGDIALAISCAVVLSLARLDHGDPQPVGTILRTATPEDSDEAGAKNAHTLWGLTAVASRVNRRMAALVYRITGSTRLRLAVVVGLTAASLGLSWLLVPKTEYLPVGNQNFLFGFMLPPPGYSLDEVAETRHPIDEVLRPLWESEPGSPEARRSPAAAWDPPSSGSSAGRSSWGSGPGEPLRVRELLPELRKLSGQLPGHLRRLQPGEHLPARPGRGPQHRHRRHRPRPPSS